MNDEDDSSDPFDHLPEGHPSRDRDYDVGKHRPPIGGRFPPGKSGNPKGKKKGKHVSTLVTRGLHCASSSDHRGKAAAKFRPSWRLFTKRRAKLSKATKALWH